MFHTVLLAPADYWTQPAGWLLGLMLAAGVYGSVSALTGRIGRTRQVAGEIIALEQIAPDIVTVHCRLEDGWNGHQPGQFAFITFDLQEGAHPFTIASANRSDRSISFQIKALGDFTRDLSNRFKTGQSVTVEGP